MLLQRLPTSTRLSREPSTTQRTRPHCSSDPQSPPSVSGRLNWASPCTPQRSLHVAAASSARFPCSVHRHRRLASYDHTSLESPSEHSHDYWGYVGLYEACYQEERGESNNNIDCLPERSRQVTIRIDGGPDN